MVVLSIWRVDVFLAGLLVTGYMFHAYYYHYIIYVYGIFIAAHITTHMRNHSNKTLDQFWFNIGPQSETMGFMEVSTGRRQDYKGGAFSRNLL